MGCLLARPVSSENGAGGAPAIFSPGSVRSRVAKTHDQGHASPEEADTMAVDDLVIACIIVSLHSVYSVARCPVPDDAPRRFCAVPSRASPWRVHCSHRSLKKRGQQAELSQAATARAASALRYSRSPWTLEILCRAVWTYRGAGGAHTEFFAGWSAVACVLWVCSSSNGIVKAGSPQAMDVSYGCAVQAQAL